MVKNANIISFLIFLAFLLVAGCSDDYQSQKVLEFQDPQTPVPEEEKASIQHNYIEIPDLRQAPPNPAFVEYVKRRELGLETVFTDTGRGLGYIPGQGDSRGHGMHQGKCSWFAIVYGIPR